MSQVKILPIVSMEQAETLDDKIDEKQWLKNWLFEVQNAENEKKSQKAKKESVLARHRRLYSFD